MLKFLLSLLRSFIEVFNFVQSQLRRFIQRIP